MKKGEYREQRRVRVECAVSPGWQGTAGRGTHCAGAMQKTRAGYTRASSGRRCAPGGSTRLDKGGEAARAGRDLERPQLRGVAAVHEVGQGHQGGALHGVLPPHKQRLGGGLVHLGCRGGRGGGGGSLLRFTAVQPSLPDGNGWLAARWLGGGRRSVPCLRHHRKPALQPPSSANYKLHLRSPPTSVARRCRRPPAPTRGRAQPAVALVVEGLLVVLGQEAALEPDLVGHAGIPALGAAIEQGEAAGMAAPALPPALPYADTAR